MTTRAAYVIGGAGTGKSTWMLELLAHLGAELGPQETLWSGELYSPHHQRNYRVDFRGHRWTNLDRTRPPLGAYLGVMREAFPGADGLIRTCAPIARDWLANGPLPDMIVGEGRLLGTKPFLKVLHEHADLTVVHLYLDEDERLRRIAARGHEFTDKYSRTTVTRSAKTAEELEAEEGIRVRHNPSALEMALWLEGW